MADANKRGNQVKEERDREKQWGSGVEEDM